MFLFTQQLKDKEGMFARTFTISKKFELSQATISIKREQLEQKENAVPAGTQTGTSNPGTSAGTGAVPAAASEGTIGDQFGGPVVPGSCKPELRRLPRKPLRVIAGINLPRHGTAADVNEVVQLGRPQIHAFRRHGLFTVGATYFQERHRICS